MITEDYVSFEIAKLLKKKGFDDEYTNALYDKNGELYFIELLSDYSSHPDNDTDIAASTLYVAMKWLRENYGLHCDIGYDDLDWFWNIISVSDDIPVEDRPKMIQLGTACHKTYEDACADAIKYCLENLI